jgi:hypothetical protein
VKFTSSTVKSSEPKVDPGDKKNVLYVDVLEADDLTGPQQRKKKVACQYPNGALVYGKDAEKQPHRDIHISARAGDRVTWWGSRPFEVKFKDDGGEAFIDPPPWRSKRRPNGLHLVESSPARPDLPGLAPDNFIEVEFVLVALKLDPPHEPDLDIEALDPHVIIEP